MGSITFVGMDVHKATITVAVAEGVRGGEVRQLGTFPNRAEVIAKLAERLAGAGLLLPGRSMRLRPPSKPGDRVKTDRRDALSLAKLHRAS